MVRVACVRTHLRRDRSREIGAAAFVGVVGSFVIGCDVIFLRSRVEGPAHTVSQRCQ